MSTIDGNMRRDMQRIKERRQEERFGPYKPQKRKVHFKQDSITPKQSFFDTLRDYRKKKGLKPVPEFVSPRKIGEPLIGEKKN